MDAVSRTTTQTMHTVAAQPLHQGFFTHAQGAPDDTAVFGPTTQLDLRATAGAGTRRVGGARGGRSTRG